jgi:putative methyltransferase (TIGR04325 family)
MASGTEQDSIWRGVYGSFAEAPDTPPVFNSDVWIVKQAERVLEKLESFDSGPSIPSGAVSNDYPLASMVALLAQDQSLRVIDFGGAMGQSYLELIGKVPHARERLEYTIVEVPAVVQNVPEAMRRFEKLVFLDDYRKAPDGADVVHLGSTLQYIDDWQGFLSALIQKFNPRTFILSDLLVGDIPSFVTIQRYYEHSIKVRFINIEEFLRFWTQTNYSLIYRAYYQPFGNDSYFPNGALPETHRLKTACHMVFSRDDG